MRHRAVGAQVRLLRWFLTKVTGECPDGFTAFGRTWWFISDPSPGLVAHEALHVEQQKRDGWRFYVRYAWDFVRYGYRGVRYEREAYALQDAITSQDSDRGG